MLVTEGADAQPSLAPLGQHLPPEGIAPASQAVAAMATSKDRDQVVTTGRRPHRADRRACRAHRAHRAGATGRRPSMAAQKRKSVMPGFEQGPLCRHRRVGEWATPTIDLNQPQMVTGDSCSD